ncbi:MAG TPA: ribonuclease J [Candidatus Chromulinivoraceae bacterium]|nr:ribonuclease J [Candidatus Chromulinivoraceae bacterium]
MKETNKYDVTHASRRKSDKAERLVRPYRTTKTVNASATPGGLRIIPLGGQQGIGEKNMIVLEYGNDALILDCGFELGIDLPGINYAIPVTEYLESIRHKIRGYVISHGHLDHIGGLTHIVPKFPAPIFGSRFTIGMVQTQFEKANEDGVDFQPNCRALDMDKHERVSLGELKIELVRVTHAIPECSAIVVDTPVGRVINTGDFRLDPEPLDAMPSDIIRLKQLGDEGVLLLMSESTNTTKPGRTPTERTLQDSFYELMDQVHGRIIAATFSSNMNRIQMIVMAAAHFGRKVAFDGRSMTTVAELAVRLGNLKIPKNTLVSMREAGQIPDDQLVIICTGGQGEPGAALSRMAIGEHQYIKLKKGDNVVISSTPIPGNEQSYQRIGDSVTTLGAKLFRHPTHEIDGCGPLHVSGHGNRDEHAEMIQLTRPNYLMPIYGGALNRKYHKDVGLLQGLPKRTIIMVDNGDVTEFDQTKVPRKAGRVTAGALLVDQTGSVVPEIVTKDRLLLREDGFVVVIVTLDRTTGRQASSPDIITRGHLSIRDNAKIMDGLRQKVCRLPVAKRMSRAGIDQLKDALKDMTAAYLFEQTGQTPIVIPVVNVAGLHRDNIIARPAADMC